MNDAAQAHPTAGQVLIALLATCARLGWLTLALTLHAGWLLGTATPGPLRGTMSVVLVLGLGAQYLAARLALDARLFRALYRPEADAAIFDQALAELFGRPLPESGVRPLAERWHGTRRLIRRFMVLCAVQAALWSIGLLLHAWM
ncbi:hypothetical protein [Chitiniphilus eburneus]|uniref:Uncharacterized protein n=1 Tax=Chitiniphilus eburneus TaxID=2571148 RepID=A0A4V5MQV4_9NEIS|nr:hypothetical protein [Chitiniphilus eburneus]TJZ73988.1 hypothetical protein FAZ21_08505 [Chitiniphilus eburneus]